METNAMKLGEFPAKKYPGKRKTSSTNGAGQTGCLHIEEQQSRTYHPAQNSSPSGSRTST